MAIVDCEDNAISLTSYHLPVKKNPNKDTELNQLQQQQQIGQVAKLPNPKQLNQQQAELSQNPQAQRPTQQQVQPALRQNSRERSQKTVAFGLTTNIEDTVERHKRINTVGAIPIPTVQKTMTTAVRPSLITNTTTSATKQQMEELQKELKCYSTQINELKVENKTLRKTTDELRDSLSDLTYVVTDLSSRLLAVEERITENSGVGKRGNITQISPIAVNNCNRNRAGENAEKIMSPSMTANAITAGVSSPLSTAIVPTTKMTAAGESILSHRRMPSATRQPQPPAEITRPKTTSNTSLRQSSETRRVMTLLENRIRERPELLHRMWSILMALDDDVGNRDNASVLAPSIVTTKVPEPTSKVIPVDNTRPPLSERTQHRENLPPASNSPYNAKFTQKFTLEREVFYSRQMDTSSPHDIHHNQRNQNQHQQYNQASAQYPRSAAADAEFFEESHIRDEYDSYGRSENYPNHTTNTNATLMNTSLLDEADETLARHQQPDEVAIRDRYRRRRV